MTPRRKTSWTGLLSAFCVVLLAASGCGGGGKALSSDTKSTCHSGATNLTFWAWVPGFENTVDAFNRSHPDICVDLQNVGAGTTEYTKLVTAFHAGSGAPDVAEVEYLNLSGFEVTHSLADLSKQGAGDLERVNTPALWRQVTQGGAIYGLPLDSGPVSLLYNQKLFQKYDLPVPKTWAEFAATAAKLHQRNSKIAIANFWPEDANFLFSMMGQNGSVPFDWSGGRDIKIDLTCASCLQFADYWQKLIDAGEITMVPDNAAQEFGVLDSGLVASVPRAAWGPKYLANAATKTLGDWRVARLPQWSASADVTPMWGGSSYTVTAQSKHKKQATEFVRWLTSSAESWKIVSGPPSFEFPSNTTTLHSKAFLRQELPLTGKQQVEQDFASAAKALKPINWPPFMTYVASAVLDEFAKVVQHSETMSQALKALQANLVSYAKREGFTVTG